MVSETLPNLGIEDTITMSSSRINYRFAGNFSGFHFNIYTSERIEPLKSSTFIYGTIAINGTYHFCFLYSSFFSFPQVKDHEMTIFACNTQTFKIHNSHRYRIEILIGIESNFRERLKSKEHIASNSQEQLLLIWRLNIAKLLIILFVRQDKFNWITILKCSVK